MLGTFDPYIITMAKKYFCIIDLFTLHVHELYLLPFLYILYPYYYSFGNDGADNLSIKYLECTFFLDDQYHTVEFF